VSTEAAAPRAITEPLRAPRAVAVAWALLVVDTLGSQGSDTIVAIPRPVIQMVTFGSVLAAFVIALVLNPRLQVKPSAYLFLLTLLVIESIAASAQLESGLGAFVRCARFTCFMVTLWLLSRWWFDAQAFVRAHIRALCGVLLTVLAGLALAPGLALPGNNSGRLTGAVWPLSPPQVGQFAAIAIGLTVVLWMSRRTDGRSVAYIAIPAVLVLMLSHTRTAALGLIVGLLIAGVSLALTNARARRTMARAVLCAALVAAAFGQVVQEWVLRGQDEENFANLTGRAKVWDALLARPRTLNEKFFGVGLTDKSFNGLPIDSSWLAAYHEQGLFGVTVLAAFLVTLLIVAVLRPPSPNRACAIFLVAYCLVASYTEASMTDASPYLLYLTLAAALLSTGRVIDPPDTRPVTEGGAARAP
jgi:O-antigen ligase